MRTIISNMRTARMAMMFILAMLTTLTVQAAADKTALDAAVSEAETYNSSILESNPKQAEVPRAATSLAAKYYDLQGRRLSQPSRAGVYINNGVVKVNK